MSFFNMHCFGSAHAVVVLAALAAASGCGGGAASTTVEGNVSFNGQPVTSGLINFKSASGQPIGGAINADGSYKYDLPPGEYQVRIDSPPQVPEGYQEGDPIPKLQPRLVPEKFASFATSGLSATVTGESPQQLDFTLP